MRGDIHTLLTERILLLDGGLGTQIQALGLREADFRGREFLSWKCPLAGCMDLLCLTTPRKIAGIHRAYFEAGADIVSTNSFNANAISLKEYGLEGYARRIARAAATIAREVADEMSVDGRPRFVAGSMGPTSKTASIAASVEDSAARDVTFAELAEAYYDQASGLAEGGADLFLLETVFDTLNAKAAIFAIERLRRETGCDIPLMISVTVSQKAGRTLSGQTIEAFWTSIRHARPLSVGINCSFGAREMLPHLERLATVADCYISVHPNAGLPNVSGGYDETPESFAAAMRPYAERGLVNIIGGCCGTTPSFISALAPLREAYAPRGLPSCIRETVVCGLEQLRIVPEANFINIGERCNVAGSAKFARMIREGGFAGAIAVARAQVAAGAQVVDICMDDGLIDGPSAMRTFVNMISGEVDIARVPLMIDSSSLETLIAGLECCQGKAIVNSISLKEGPEEFLRRAALIHSYGAAAVVMLFDEEGQATSFSRKTAVAARAYELLVSSGFPAEDIIFDPNILAVATGIPEHDRYALDFIEAVRWIKANLPYAKVSGGVSNLSFAFRGNNAVREAMHSAFLYHARQAGMDMGIVNPQMLRGYDDIPSELLERVEDVLLCRRPDASERLAEYAAYLKAAEMPGQAGHDGIQAGHDGTQAGHDGIQAGHDGTQAGHDGIQAGHDGSPDRHCRPDRQSPDAWRSTSVGERISYAMLHGIGDFIEEDCLEALRLSGSPMDVIGKMMMPAMERVGVLFGDGKMFLPQVVKAAGVMKRGVAALQPYISRGAQSNDSQVDTQTTSPPGGYQHIQQPTNSQSITLHGAPRVVIATVKGDIHDIGKNIVSVVMAVGGCEIIDLGVMVEPAEIVAAVRERGADFVCLSGLITPSLEQMIVVCRELRRAGISIPVIVGGATTSPMHTAVKMAPEYDGLVIHSTDASRNMQIINSLTSPRARVFQAEVLAEQKRLRELYLSAQDRRPLEDYSTRLAAAVADRGACAEVISRGTQTIDTQPITHSPLRKNTQGKCVNILIDKEVAATGKMSVFHHYDIATVEKHFDWEMFYVEWGVKNDADKQQLRRDAEAMLERIKGENILDLQGVVGHFPVHVDGDDIIVNRPEIPGQAGNDGAGAGNDGAGAGNDDDASRHCRPDRQSDTEVRLAMLRNQTAGEENLSVADFAAEAGEVTLFAITAGAGLKRFIELLRETGDEYGAFMAKVIADRLAEALAEEVVPAKEGERHAFGYPSCPDHSLKKEAFKLLHVEDNCDMHLTDSYMIDPAESICGMVIPGAKYFAVGHIGADQTEDYARRRGTSPEVIKTLIPRNIQ